MRQILLCFLMLLSTLSARAGEVPDPAKGFLLQRQEADGSWNDRTHHLIPPALAEDLDGSTRSAVFTTGLVIRALVTTSKNLPQDQVVLSALRRGTEFLCRLQQEDGAISADASDHGVATHALRLVHATGLFPEIAPKAKQAMKFLVSWQRVRLGWSQNDQDPQRIDLWAGFWCLQALERDSYPELSRTKLSNHWWNLIGKAAFKENPESGFPANFIMSPDGSWSLDQMAKDATAAALFHADHPLMGQVDTALVTAMRNRVSTAKAVDRDAGIDWPQRLALARTPTSDARKPWPWATSFPSEMTVDGPAAGSWPATGSSHGRLTATASAVILRRMLDQTISVQISQALAFFHRQINRDGGWNDHFAEREAQNSAISTTSLVVCSFLGSGYDHKTPNRFKKSVEAGLQYLRNLPDVDGLSTVELAMSTMALCEAYAMTNDPQLKLVSTNRIHRLLARQTDLPGAAILSGAWGTDHLKPGFQHDTWTTMWCTMAMKSALAGGLPIQDGLERTKPWLEAMVTHHVAGEALNFPAVCHWDAAGVRRYESQANACALVIAVMTSHTGDEPLVQNLVRAVSDGELPRWNNQQYDLGYAYSTMLGLFLTGGPAWAIAGQSWSSPVPTVDTNEAFLGSIADGQLANGMKVGRITATAYLTLANEISYRYQELRPRD